MRAAFALVRWLFACAPPKVRRESDSRAFGVEHHAEGRALVVPQRSLATTSLVRFGRSMGGMWS